MKFSEQWLREWVDPQLETGELVEQLTMAGLEVDGYEAVSANLDQVIVGEVLEVTAHPNADHLHLCTVATGDGATCQVVCGAPNVRVGLKAPFAPVGASLGDMRIKKAKLRGEQSAGMLCSERELGISESHEGLLELPDDAPTGTDICDYLKLDDVTIDLDLTPNRSDCLGMVGLAREVGVLNNLDLVRPEMQPVPATIEDTFPIEIESAAGCPRYVGRIIRNVDMAAKSPLWLREKLRRSDVRSIDPVVDVTNYVMIELGQPLHAFDLDQLQHSVIVRDSAEGESITLLDGKDLTLNPGTLLISDGSGPIAMAGIMGGLGTAVSASTTNIFLESAFFSPLALSGVARSHGLNTDASHRFERGVDSGIQVQAIERATELLLQIAGGEAGPVSEQVIEDELPEQKHVQLRSGRVKRLLGIDVSDTEIDQILGRLGLSYEKTVEEQEVRWLVSSPSHRFDIALEVDLIEEISRIYGYNNLPVSVPRVDLNMADRSEAMLTLAEVRKHLVARGYQEAINYSFVDPALQGLLDSVNEPIALKNPLSAEMGVMRTTLWCGLIKALIYNKNRQTDRVRLFETGLTFIQPPNQQQVDFEDIRQEKMLAGLISGPRLPEAWSNDGSPVDFYDLKGDLESILQLTGDYDSFRFEKGEIQTLHPGQTAVIKRGEHAVGHMGLLHPRIQRHLEIQEPAFLFELDLELLLKGRLPEYTELSRFPGVRRDIAIIVDENVVSAKIRAVILENAGDWLQYLKLFDVYQGKGIDPNRKSIALGLTFQHPSRTLTDEEINDSLERVVLSLQQQFGASLRN